MLNVIAPVLIYGTVGLLLYYIYKQYISKQYNHPPGPKPWPIVGNIPDPYSQPLIYKVLVEKYKKIYGDVIRFTRLGQNFIYVNDYKLGTEMFKNYPEDTSGRPTNGIDHLSTGGMDPFFTRSMDDTYKELRKHIMMNLRKCAEPKRMFDISNEVLDKFVDYIINKHPNSDTEGFYTEPICYWIGHNLLINVFYSESVDYDEKYLEYKNNIETLMDLVAQMYLYDITPLNHLPFPKKQEAIKYSRRIAKEIEDHVSLRKSKKLYKSDPKYFIDYALQIQDSQESDPKLYPNLPKLNDQYVAYLALDIYFAGLDAFGIGLCWTIGLLALYPDIQEKVRVEYQKLKAQKHPQDYNVSWIDEMPYVNAVNNEIMRWHSLSAFTSYHRMQADVKCGQYDIPKDSIVALNIYGSHFDERYWNEPFKFNPDRFLSEDKKKFQLPKAGFMPFGYGRRICVAERYTVKETHAVFTTRICNEFDLVWSKKNEKNEVDEDPTNTFFRHTAPFYVEFKPRKED